LKIAIIGAGMAGLSAATHLVENGHSVTVFEKSRGIGGRMSTRREGDYEFDHGAQYFTVRNDQFFSAIMEWEKMGIASLWEARIGSFNDNHTIPYSMNINRFVGVPSMNAIPKFLAQNVNVILSSKITGVSNASGGWVLTSEDGKKTNAFDACIFAIPKPQIAALMDAEAHFPELKSDISFLSNWTLMVALKERLQIDFDGIYVYNSPINWMTRNNSKPQRSAAETWVVQAKSDWSKRYANSPKERITDLMLEEFKRISGATSEDLAFYTTHFWLYSLAKRPMSRGYCWNSKLKLGVCGDWMQDSKVEGAYFSGRQLAGEISAG
jgi:renalase